MRTAPTQPTSTGETSRFNTSRPTWMRERRSRSSTPLSMMRATPRGPSSVTPPPRWKQPPPTIKSVAITSDPGSDETYGTGDSIEITVTFSENVTVTGTPDSGYRRRRRDQDRHLLQHQTVRQSEIQLTRWPWETATPMASPLHAGQSGSEWRPPSRTTPIIDAAITPTLRSSANSSHKVNGAGGHLGPTSRPNATWHPGMADSPLPPIRGSQRVPNGTGCGPLRRAPPIQH